MYVLYKVERVYVWHSIYTDVKSLQKTRLLAHDRSRKLRGVARCLAALVIADAFCNGKSWQKFYLQTSPVLFVSGTLFQSFISRIREVQFAARARLQKNKKVRVHTATLYSEWIESLNFDDVCVSEF